MVSVWEGGLWQTFGVLGPSQGWGWCCVDGFFLPTLGSALHHFCWHALHFIYRLASAQYIQIHIHIHCIWCCAHAVCLFFALCYLQNGLYAVLMLHSSHDWLIGHWWVVHSPGATWFQWNYIGLFLFLFLFYTSGCVPFFSLNRQL